MSSPVQGPRISYIPARKWHDLAEEVLKNPDAYYEAAQAQLERKIQSNAKSGWMASLWGRNRT